MPEPARLASDRVIYSFSPEHPPAIIVESGDRIVIETRDAYDRQFQGNLDINSYLRERNSRPSNPATGPIFRPWRRARRWPRREGRKDRTWQEPAT